MLACLLAGCARRAHDKLVVGMELQYVPFEMTDELGHPRGISVDMAQALGQFLGKPVKVENTPFDGLIPALKTDKIDLIISSMTATPERAQSIDFSDPYVKTGLCLLLGRNSKAQSIQDLDQPGKVVAVKQGTTGHNYAKDHVKRAKLLVLDQADACVEEVRQGKAEAFIYDQISVYQYWMRNPATMRALLKPFKEEAWAIGVRKGNTNLLAQVNQFLKDFRAKRGFEQLGDHYLKEQKDAFRKMGIPFYF